MLKKISLWRMLSFCVLICLTLIVRAGESVDRRLELQHLIKHDCGSCHGMTLSGGLGPSLKAEALKNKSDELLMVTISEGRAGTPMPAWKSLLSKNDITIIIKLLRNSAVN